jgi:Ig-like domain-containing protein
MQYEMEISIDLFDCIVEFIQKFGTFPSFLTATPHMPHAAKTKIIEIYWKFYLFNFFAFFHDTTVPPQIVDEESSDSHLAVREHQNITLNCNAAGFPAPRITWRREDGKDFSVDRRKKGKNSFLLMRCLSKQNKDRKGKQTQGSNVNIFVLHNPLRSESRVRQFLVELHVISVDIFDSLSMKFSVFSFHLTLQWIYFQPQNWFHIQYKFMI